MILKTLFIFFLIIGLCLTSFAQDKKDNLLKQSGYIKAELIFPLDNKPAPQCHASTIESTEEGLIASWFGGTEEKNPDVGIWISRNLNGQWTKPVEVANGIQDDGKRYPCWNPVLFKPSGAPLMLFYKVGPDPINWWGLFITSNDNGITWSEPTRLHGNVLGPIKNKPDQLTNGKVIAPSSTENNGWKIHFEISSDTCKTWNIVKPEGTDNVYDVIQPTILIHGNNKLQALCRSKQGLIVQSWSTDGGDTWGEMTTINLPNPNSGIDAVTLKDGIHLLVYNHSGMIEGKWGGLRTPLDVAISKNGIDWTPVLILENEPGEYSYPAVIQAADGLVHITYTYNRESIKHAVIDPAKLMF